MTGTTIAQAIPIAISPILTRIYTPQDFGIFALYMSIASILSAIATGRYELAIMHPKKDEDAISIVFLSVIIASCISFLSLCIVFFLNSEITSILGNPEISLWLYFLPLTVLLTGIYQSLNYWNNRKKHYKRLATSRVIQNSSAVTTQLTTGFYGTVGGGLIIGHSAGLGIATSILGILIYNEDRVIILKIRKLKVLALAKKYIDHPKFLTLSHGISSVYMQIPVFFIGRFFDLSILGFYTLANRLISLPGTLMANSIGDVFRQRAAEDYNKTGKFDKVLLKTFFSTLKVSIIPFSILYFTINDVFSFVYGSTWGQAGKYAQILIIGAFFSFIITPIDKAALITNKLMYIFKWHVTRFFFYMLLFFLGYYYHINVELFLYGLISINITFYLFDFYMELNFSRGY